MKGTFTHSDSRTTYEKVSMTAPKVCGRRAAPRLLALSFSHVIQLRKGRFTKFTNPIFHSYHPFWKDFCIAQALLCLYATHFLRPLCCRNKIRSPVPIKILWTCGKLCVEDFTKMFLCHSVVVSSHMKTQSWNFGRIHQEMFRSLDISDCQVCTQK